MELVKNVIARAVAWVVGLFTDIVQMFRDAQPTEAEREANRQRRERERQQAEAQRKKQALDQWQATYLQRLSTCGTEVLGRELYAVLQRIYSSLHVMRPLSAANLPARIRMIGGLPWVVFEVRRQTLDAVERDQLVEYERYLQAEIAEDLAAGLVWEVSPTFDGRTPSIICGPLAVMGETLYIPMAFTDFDAIRRWWWSRQADQEHPKPPKDVEDERF